MTDTQAERLLLFLERIAVAEEAVLEHLHQKGKAEALYQQSLTVRNQLEIGLLRNELEMSNERRSWLTAAQAASQDKGAS